jgi:hypothetical protein
MEERTMTMNVIGYAAQSAKDALKYRFVIDMASLEDR